jgi:hypothetical protein
LEAPNATDHVPERSGFFAAAVLSAACARTPENHKSFAAKDLRQRPGLPGKIERPAAQIIFLAVSRCGARGCGTNRGKNNRVMLTTV